MWLNCSYCGKLVHTIRLNFQGKSSQSSRGKLVRTLGRGFNLTSVTSNRRRVDIYGLHTRLTCKTCKSKFKTQKPLDYLTKALESTFSATDEIDADDINSNNYIISEKDLFQTDEDESLHRDESIQNNAWNTKTVSQPEPIPWDNMNTVNVLEHISEQERVVRELIDIVPNLPNERYMRHFVYNMQEQMRERNNFLGKVDVPEPIKIVKNIPVPIAQQRGLARLEVKDIAELPDRNHLDARIAVLGQQLKDMEDEYGRLSKRIKDTIIMASKKVDKTVAAVLIFLSRNFPE